ncbi:MAG: Tim44 domain-containing protein [Candidatus Saccharibacteria bacterium]|nr:Tim44 domain-containing protein [Moraxellaceae bacterium]
MNLRTRSAITSLILATLVLSPLAEARRMGGGSSHGMSRSNSSSSYGNSSNYNSAPARPYSTPQQAPQKSGPGWGGVAAGVAGGALVGSMLAHSGSANANTAQQPTTAAQPTNGTGEWNKQAAQPEKKGFPWFWLILLAGAGYFVYRRFAAKKNTLATNSGAPSPFGFGNNNPTAQPSGSNTNIFGQPVGGAAPSNAGFGAASPFTSNGQTLPDGTEHAAFLRQARATFLHMQTMNSASNLEELRRYFTPDMFNAVQSDIASNHDTAEFPSLNARIVDSAQENGQYITSVLYSGTVSEDLNSAPIPFSETWHFVQPIGSTDRKWLVAGIQQG